MAEITLTWHEIYMGAMIGVARRLASLRRGETNKVNNRDFGWHSDIEGACAELALAKHLGQFWDGAINTFHAPDLGRLQIRHTQHGDGCLILRPADKDEEKFCLVVGTHPTYRVCGWLLGSEGKAPEFIRDPGGTYPAWFIPQNRLNPLRHG